MTIQTNRHSSENPYTIILADDHVLFRQGVHRIISEYPDLSIIGEAGDGLQLLKILNHARPDLIILDIAMPHLRGLEAAREIKALHPHIRILLLTMHRDMAYFRNAISAGVEGYLLKEDADTELLSAIRTIRKGEKYISPILFKDLTDDLLQLYRGKPHPDPDPLTTREREILKLIAEGKSSREIGELLHISLRTVQNHRANLMSKLNVKRTADLVRYAIVKGYTVV
ncbi:MAG: response regulator [Thermodesulfobacteriota bacterium]